MYPAVKELNVSICNILDKIRFVYNNKRMKPNLKDFISAVGDKEAAKLFNSKILTVKSWRLGYRSPRQEKAKLIVKKTAKHPSGPVLYEGIYG